MKKITILVLLFIEFQSISFGQLNAVFNYKGKVLDAANLTSLPAASIYLLDLNNITIKKTQTNVDGAFVISNITKGTYNIKVQYIGYATYSKTIIVTQIDSINQILLNKINNNLADVIVKSTKPVIENKIDKTIYNVDRDISSQGGVATDILRKIPQITVDADGNVELLGNASIKFLIDGKTSALFGNSIAEALQSIPNSQIQSIEVMSSPSAKYEASGTGGIINIILKKSKLEGYNGNVNISIGSRLENGSFNTSWKHNNIGVNAFFSGNEQLNGITPNGSVRTSTSTTGTQVLAQDSRSNFGRKSYKSGFGLDWEINKSSNLTASLSFNNFSNDNNGVISQAQSQFDNNNNQVSHLLSTRQFTNTLSVNDFEQSLGYKKTLNSKGESIELTYNGSANKNNSYYQQSQYLVNNNNPFAGAHSLNPGKESEENIAIDYFNPISKTVTIEAGTRYTHQSIVSNADVFSLNSNTQQFEINQSQSYQSKYTRNIIAGYLVASYKILKTVDVKSGIRYEYTKSNAFYSQSGTTSIPDYGNIAPSFILSHKFKNNQVLKFAYTYRIERPDYKDLNPFMNLSDPHNITTGNPNLQPEIGNNVELSLNKPFPNGANLNLVLFCQYNSPDIKPYITYYPFYKIGDSVYNDVTITSRANISAETRAGLNISASLPFGDKWVVRPNLMLFNRHLINPFDEPKVLNSFGYRTSINTSYNVNKTWAVELFGNYNLGMKWQGRQPSNYSYTIATRKQILNNKGSIGLVIVNPFDVYIRQTSQLISKNTVTNSYRNIPYQSFGLSFSYKFGNLKVAKTKEGENFLFSPPSDN